jgi:tetratricopeptide (TPR) repeat protein
MTATFVLLAAFIALLVLALLWQRRRLSRGSAIGLGIAVAALAAGVLLQPVMLGKQGPLVSSPAAAQGNRLVEQKKYAEAVASFKQAAAQHPDDAALLADYAYALAMANQRNLQGEPLQLIERALKLDPRQPKALGLAGTAAFDRKDYPAAIKYWTTLAESLPADSPVVRQARMSIAEAKRLGGL